MVAWPKIVGLCALCGLSLALDRVPATHAATSATLDILPNDVAVTPADGVEIGALKPLARPKLQGGKRPLSGNPLWSVPLSVLTATQERPIFSASRRPPPTAVVAPLEPVKAPVAQNSAEVEHPPFALVGAVVGDNDAIAVLLDQTNQKVVRLRQGETNAGWMLSSVLAREVTLKKDDRSEVLVLPRPDSSAGVSGASGIPGWTAPASGRSDLSYAPFVPRSTPKNGASDGL